MNVSIWLLTTAWAASGPGNAPQVIHPAGAMPQSQVIYSYEEKPGLFGALRARMHNLFHGRGHSESMMPQGQMAPQTSYSPLRPMAHPAFPPVIYPAPNSTQPVIRPIPQTSAPPLIRPMPQTSAPRMVQPTVQPVSQPVVQPARDEQGPSTSRVEPRPAAAIQQVAAKQTEQLPLKQQFQNKVGCAEDYSWITGQLFYLHTDGGKWVLRYASVDQEDRYGGSVVLAPTVSMTNFREGDLVCVHGQILNHGRATRHLGGASYRANHIDLIERAD
jgi:hypothetical protein